jgi:amino acid permease
VDLIVDQLFNILYFIFHATDHADWITTKNLRQVVFNKVSIQIVSLIMFLPLLMTMFIKNLSFLVRLTALGVASVCTYVVYIFYKFFDNLPNINKDDIPPFFSANFGNLVGTSAVAFTIHTVVNPITKANLIQANNLRDLKISYMCGFFIYSVIGVLGSLAISGKNIYNYRI